MAQKSPQAHKTWGFLRPTKQNHKTLSSQNAQKSPSSQNLVFLKQNS